MIGARRIGKLQQRLQLEAPVQSPDAGGGVTRSWERIADVWAAVETVAADEFHAGESEGVKLTHRITLRWRPDITGAMRLRKGARIFRIVSAADADQRRRFLICRCEEKSE